MKFKKTVAELKKDVLSFDEKYKHLEIHLGDYSDRMDKVEKKLKDLDKRPHWALRKRNESDRS